MALRGPGLLPCLPAIWWRNLSLHYRSTGGWDTHSCVRPFLLCRQHPALVAATTRLATIAPHVAPPHVRNGDGERLFLGDRATIEAYLRAERDAFHLTAYRGGWLEQTPYWDYARMPHMPRPETEQQKPARERLRWIMEFALRKALGALPPLDKLQRACVERIRSNVLSETVMLSTTSHWTHKVLRA